MADQVRQYALGELMSDEDSLKHYGVLGMKWGKSRAKANASQVRSARRRLNKLDKKIDKADDALNKAVKSGSNSDVKKARQNVKNLSTERLKSPDRVTATRLTRGEKIASVLILGSAGLAIIGATSAASRRIEQKQDTGAYDK